MKRDLDKLRHSASHVLAQAVQELYPKVKLGIGPSIENGFYYDFDIKEGFTPEDLNKIEKRCKEIIRENIPIIKKEATKAEAKKILKNEPLKLELLEDLKGDITFYEQGKFIDLCAGPHVESTKEIKAFKLLSSSGAYWKGDSDNKMLQRIYGTAFYDKKELRIYLNLLEEAKKRDHRKLGEQLGLFVFSELVGPGLPLYTPKGNILRNEIVQFSRELNEKIGYKEVHTPNMNKAELFKISGHYDKFKDDMIKAVSNYSKEEYFLKPMNCPQHTQIFASKIRSYKDLPIRYADFANLYRDEKPGELSGLSRLRCFSQDDGHSFCREDQIESEFQNTLDVIKKALDTYGLDYRIRLSLWDPNNKENYLGDEKVWESSQDILRKLLKKNKIKFVEEEGEAAFYGPKMDIIAKDSLSREWQISTIQLDFNMPKRFKLKYSDKKGELATPVMIHRALIGSPERFMSIIIEHYDGKFPLWLSPVQVRIMNVNDEVLKYSESVKEELEQAGIRVELDAKNESISKKVRNAQNQKINYMVTIGEKEVKAKKLAIRTRDGKIKFGVSVSKFVKDLKEEIEEKS